MIYLIFVTLLVAFSGAYLGIEILRSPVEIWWAGAITGTICTFCSILSCVGREEK